MNALRGKSPSSTNIIAGTAESSDSAHSLTGQGRRNSLGPRRSSAGSWGMPDRPRFLKNRSSQQLFPEVQSPVMAVTENFFDFREEGANLDIWDEDNLVAKLKKDTSPNVSHLSSAPQPIELDQNVETIGGTFVDEDRSLSSRDNGHVSPPPTMTIDSSRSRAQTASATTNPEIAKLKQEIEELKAARWRAPRIHETISRLLLGEPCCLEWFKSMSDKRALLDAAIQTYDGNCIMAVLIFMRKTVNQTILLGMLKKREEAARHYINFLKQLKAWKELHTLYGRLEYKEEIAYEKLRHSRSEPLPSGRIELIKSCHWTFKKYPELVTDTRYVEEYARLTDKQKQIEELEGHGNAVVLRADTVLFTSLVDTLLHCCQKYRRSSEGHTGNPEDLRTAFNIPEKQYHHACLLAMCQEQAWEDVEQLLTTKGLFGFGKKKKSPVGFERVVKLLAGEKARDWMRTPGRKEYKAPEFILGKYLNEIDDLETRFQLATEVQVFDVGIDCLKQLRDRERMSSYINQIPSKRHPHFRPKIEALLKNSQIKWK